MRTSMMQTELQRPAPAVRQLAGRGVFLCPRPSCCVELSHARRLRFEQRTPPERFLPSRRAGK
jgi:hypothetical protein